MSLIAQSSDTTDNTETSEGNMDFVSGNKLCDSITEDKKYQELIDKMTPQKVKHRRSKKKKSSH